MILKQVLFALVLILTLSTGLSLTITSTLMAKEYTDVWLLPTVPGRSSKTAPIVKGDEKQVDIWLQYDDNEANDVLLGLEDVDTLCVVFEPPAACSVLAMEFCAICYYVTSHTTVEKFIAVSDSVSGPWQFVAGPTPSKPIDTVWTWDTLWVPFENIPDVGTNPFVAGWIKVLGDSSPNPRITPNVEPPWHSFLYRHEPVSGGPPGWYPSWHQFWIRALVRIYEDMSPIIHSVDKLPWSYTTGSRRVTAEVEDVIGIPEDKWGVASATLVYNVNGGGWQTVPMVCVDTIETVGDSIKHGIWAADIPGVGVGDSVSYYVVAEDLSGLSDTWRTIFWYKIIEGTPGNIFFYNDDFYGPPFTPDFVGMVYENVDYWDYNVRGAPDSSVIAFYTPGKGPGAPVILWNSFLHVETFAEAVGAGVIQNFLDAGGNLFMSGQDFLYGLARTYDTVTWEAGTFPNEYLKFYKTVDDAVTGTTCVTIHGVPGDTISGPFIDDEVLYVWPYVWMDACFTWIGEIIETDAIPIFFFDGDRICGTRYDTTYKYVFLYWPFAYIVEVEPDTWMFDTWAVKTLLRRVLQWFGLPVGVEPPIVGQNLDIPSIFMSSININYDVTHKLPMDIELYDVVGRKLAHLHTEVEGRGTYNWDVSQLPMGVYFIRVDLENYHSTHKLIKIR